MSKTGDVNKETPIGALVMLSVMFPGAGQLANGQTTKGVITIAISALLFVDIIVHTFIITFPLFGAYLAGEIPVIDERVLDPLGTLLIVFAIAMGIWVWALIDTIIVGKRRLAKKLDEGDFP